jgi:ABC-type bacteriocin/lantibiotic exporter with double-glycine peptidase domain
MKLRSAFDLLPNKNFTEIKPQEDLFIPDEPTIEFIDVTYALPGKSEILREFSLKINPGDKIAILGASGSGKSLLFDMLMRLREPSQGKILFSGINIKNIDHALYYSAFGFAGQNSHLMRVSLRGFLQQGWPDQRDEDIWHVLYIVGLADLIKSLPLKLDTLMGLDSWQFAAGDRQRLTLARALIRDPQVLLLDEFTAVLDAQTEAALIRNVLDISTKRTVICATHSSAVAYFFDKKVIL